MTTSSGRVLSAPGSRASHGAGQAVSTASGFDPSRDYRAVLHHSGWWVIEGPNGEIDDSGDGGFLEQNARIIAEALNSYGKRLLSWRECDSDRSGEADETRSGSAEGESAGGTAAPPTPDQGHPHD